MNQAIFAVQWDIDQYLLFAKDIPPNTSDPVTTFRVFCCWVPRRIKSLFSCPQSQCTLSKQSKVSLTKDVCIT